MGGAVPSPHSVQRLLRPWRHTRCLRRACCEARATARAFTFYPIPRETYAARRDALAAVMEPHSLLLLPAADDAVHSADILRPFRQETMLHHLFGLEEPMRRTRCPPGCAAEPQGVELTCAVMAKYASATRVVTQVFVPAPTADPGVLPWCEPQRSLEDYRAALFDPAGLDRDESVYANDIATIADHLSRLVASMARAFLSAKGEDWGRAMRPEAVRPSTIKALHPLPSLYVHLPRQLRWTGEGLHLRQSGARTGRGLRFAHPLEALVHVLYATEVHATPSSAGGVSIRCSYRQPSRAPLLPGLSAPTLSQQQRLRESLPGVLSKDATPPSLVAAACDSRLREPVVHLSLHTPLRLPTPLFDQYRLVKSPGQVVQHVYSAAATGVAFTAAMRAARTTVSEHVVEAAFHNAVARIAAALGPSAGVGLAYVPVVAVGPSASRIHYTANNRVGCSGDWLRLDAGVEVGLVPTDCTRTFPVYPRDASAESYPVMSVRDRTTDTAAAAAERVRRRRDMYTGLLQLQRTLLCSVRCGADIQEVADLHVELTAALLTERLGVSAAVRGESREGGMPRLVRRLFCAHAFGHYFGLDIHENPPPQRLGESGSRSWAGGMMHTVEPGVYIPERHAPLYGALGLDSSVLHIPDDLLGVGMQIEDDILVLPSTRADAVGDTDRPTMSCPWTRHDYLAAVCAAYSDLVAEGERTWSLTRDPFLLSFYEPRVPLLAHSRSSVPGALWAVVLLVFTQRVALQGVEGAAAALAADVERIQTHYMAKHADAPWYPFDIVVLTALIPKDVEAMSHVMREEGP